MMSRKVRNWGRPRVIFCSVRRCAGVKSVLNKQMTMLEQVPRFSVATRLRWRAASFGRGRRRAATLRSGLVAASSLRTLGHGPQDRLGQFLDDVEFADLVRHVAGNTSPKGSGYSGEASVVTPRNVKLRGCN